MSYILEALRKAQAERERGQVPGLDARPLADALPPAAAERAGLARWAAAGVGLGVVALVAAGLWWLQPGREAPRAAAQIVVAAPAPAEPAPPPTVAPAPKALPTVVSAPPEKAAAPTTAPSVARAPVAAASAAIRESRLAQMPPELRRELPPLNVGGSMWSENAASRFVIIDGQVLREGEPAAAGVRVERIAQKAAWLRWRDWRIELAF